MRPRSVLPRRCVGGAGLVTLVVLGAALVPACGRAVDGPALSASAQRGQVLAAEYGCSGCHAGLDSVADVGPTWVGAWGSTVGLVDGTTVVVDREFVIAAVRDPAAQLRAGAWVRMPYYSEFHLPDEDLELIIEYVRAMGSTDGDG